MLYDFAGHDFAPTMYMGIGHDMNADKTRH